MGQPVNSYKLSLEHISKTFGELRANDKVNLDVRRGTVHAVLGENGAGKSTLMNILYGLYRPDEGRILVDGRETVIDSPRSALAAGIGMVHQHFMLVGELTVTENIVLGMKGQGLRLDLASHTRKLEALSESFGFEVDPDAEVVKLPIGMQQRVEILKLLYHNAEILILDEPTSVLTPNETGPFFELLERLKAAGKTIIFITHKLDEVMAVADEVTVMRDGRVQAFMPTAETDPTSLARIMVGRDVLFEVKRSAHATGEAVLEVSDLCATSDRGLQALDHLSFAVKGGEVFGIAGVDGNGQAELAAVIAGLRPADSGRVLISGQDITHESVRDRTASYGLAYVPEDRHRDGLVLDESVAQNMILRRYRDPAFARFGFFDRQAIRSHAERLSGSFDVRLRSVDQEVRYLSGGNQQKVILARELESEPKVLVVAQPTKGLDVGAIEFVQSQILRQRDLGVAVLYISTELEHLLDVCDRVGVLFRGRLMDTVGSSEATPERIGPLMAGMAAFEATV